uniref:Uncharacterized protein n=1 Tax=Meloidogyne enterolobii TaxID=390850 RepID=A0A6V7UHU8_MELEN|nr:unnamed protein product [Meloidogyne enterolobii]
MGMTCLGMLTTLLFSQKMVKRWKGHLFQHFSKRSELDGKYIFEPGTTTVLKTKEIQKDVELCGNFVTPMET